MAVEVAKGPSLPPYPEMILEAIDGLGDPNGSNKSSISKYIESKYGELPAAHASLLTAHLARMKESGELVFLKNNYFRAGAATTPVKRGRGRPKKDPLAPPASPKPKPAAKPASSSAPDTGTVRRGRGRPPKPKDPSVAAAAIASSKFPKARGRPPKRARQNDESDAPPAAAAAPPVVVSGQPPVKRGRGRPPKALAAVGGAAV